MNFRRRIKGWLVSGAMSWFLTASLPGQEFNLIHTFNGIGTGYTRERSQCAVKSTVHKMSQTWEYG
jgi:hypothetical protein